MYYYILFYFIDLDDDLLRNTSTIPFIASGWSWKWCGVVQQIITNKKYKRKERYV